MTLRRVLVLFTSLATMLLLLASTVTAKPPGAGPPGPGADQEYSFDIADGPVFDIAAAPDGSILVTQGSSVKEIRRGDIGLINEFSTEAGLNGLAVLGQKNVFATSAGLDLGVGAGVWHVTSGNAELVGDVETFEEEHDPDVAVWKDPVCEAAAQFSPGPQSNPYHLTSLSGNSVLVGDAAGNTVLSVERSGQVDWVAVLTPPKDGGEFIDFFADGEAFEPFESGQCFVQPVATSVAIGPDGAYYVGELTGLQIDVTSQFFVKAVKNKSRVWRVDPGVRQVTCPSAHCTVFKDGFTSIIDVAFGPDDDLYVVEYDENSWLATDPGNLGETPAGGAIHACDLETASCAPVEGQFEFPSAITFDKWGNLWLLENNIFSPTVRKIDY